MLALRELRAASIGINNLSQLASLAQNKEKRISLLHHKPPSTMQSTPHLPHPQ